MPLSTYAANALNNHLNGKTSFTMPAAIWAALVTTNSTPDTPGTECTYTGYARVQIAAAGFAASAAGAALVTTAITWPSRSDAGATQTVVGIVLYDASTGGNALRYLNGLSLAVVQGTQPQYAANTLGTSMS